MKKIIDGLKYWGQLLLLPIYWLSFLVPRNKRIWLFGSTFGRRFADNPRYLFLEVSAGEEGELAKAVRDELGLAENKKVRPIWISHRLDIVNFLQVKGYEAYYYASPKGRWYALIGGVYFYDNYSKDINFWLSGGAMKVNLWHGIPLKMIQHDNLHDTFRHPRNKWEKIRNFPRNISDEKPSDYIVSPSKMFDEIFARAFQTEKVFSYAYPRWNVLKNEIDEADLGYKNSRFCLPMEKRYLNRIKSYKEKCPDGKVIAYMPTFRDSETQLIAQIKEVGLATIQDYLKEQDYMVVIKLHPKSKIKAELKMMLQGCSKRIVLVRDDCDSNLFMSMADVLVTDYSSCYFDYLITDRPIVYFNYDYDAYISESRDLYFDYDEMTAGEKVGTLSELGKALEDVFARDSVSEVQRELREKVMG